MHKCPVGAASFTYGKAGRLHQRLAVSELHSPGWAPGGEDDYWLVLTEQVESAIWSPTASRRAGLARGPFWDQFATSLVVADTDDQQSDCADQEQAVADRHTCSKLNVMYVLRHGEIEHPQHSVKDHSADRGLEDVRWGVPAWGSPRAGQGTSGTSRWERRGLWPAWWRRWR